MEETTLHLFFYCSFSKKFWSGCAQLIFGAYGTLPLFSLDLVLFLDCKHSQQTSADACRLICLMGKYHIDKCRTMKRTPDMELFHVDLEALQNSVSLSNNLKAPLTSKTLAKVLDTSIWLPLSYLFYFIFVLSPYFHLSYCILYCCKKKKKVWWRHVDTKTHKTHTN